MSTTPPTCGLCGTSHGHGVVFDSPWSTYYRAVYCIGPGIEEPRLSGLARYQGHDDDPHMNYLPPEAHQRFDDPRLDPVSLIHIRGVSPPGSEMPESQRETDAWGFRFHDSCWRLLEQACAPRPVDLEMLWRILRSVPHSLGLPFWGHNFGGLYISTRRDRYNGTRIALLGGFSSLMIPSAYYDPFEVPELRTRLAQMRIQADSAVPPNENVPPVTPSPASPDSVDPFWVLPVELRDLILAFVDTEDTLPFRLASRAIASTPLSQSFFQSRFWPGREWHVFFDGFLISPSERIGIDWRGLYRLSKERIKHNLVGLGERNRLRIWKQTAQPLARATVEISRLSELKGRSDWSQDTPRYSWKSVEASHNFDPELFGEVQRCVFEAEIELPASNIEAIHVSLVEFFGTKFISGLVFETEHGEDIEIGYVIPGAEEPLLVEARLEGFHIAADDRGFHAISPYIGQHMQSEYLDWVGDRADLPVQTLKCTAGTVQRIRAIFDGFRLQALYIPETGSDR